MSDLTPPNIPQAGSNVDPNVRRGLDSIRGFFDKLFKSGGAVTKRDLAGILNPDGSPSMPWLDTTIPPRVTGVSAVGAFRTIILTWDDARYSNLAHYEVWRSETDSFTGAIRIGATNATVFSDSPPIVSLSKTYWYWVRIISTAANEGPWSESASASTANDPAYVLELLTNQITGSQLAIDLASRIDKIDTPSSGLVDLIDALSVSILDFIPDQAAWWDRLLVEKAISDATVVIDPDTGHISLNAFTANITPEDLTRINSLEFALNSANGTILSHTNTLVEQAETLTAHDTRLTQAEGEISLRASTAYVDAKAQQVTDLVGGDAAATFGDDVPNGLLSLLFAAKDAKDESRINSANIAIAQFDIKSNADAIIAEASARLDLGATVANNYAALLDEQSARAAADTAETNARLALAAVVDANTAAITSEQTARANADSAEAEARIALGVRVSSAEAAIISEQSARADADTAETNARLALGARVDAAEAAIVTEQSARASGDSANASSITTLQTTVGGHTTSIQTQQSSIDGIKAQYTVKLDANGKITGFGLMTDGVTSSFQVVADRFSICNNSGTGTKYPFIVDATYGVVMDTALIRDLTATNIRSASISVDKLYSPYATLAEAVVGTGHITNAMIGNTIQSAVYIPGAGGTGWLIDKAGTIRGQGIIVGHAAVNTLQIAENAVIVPVFVGMTDYDSVYANSSAFVDILSASIVVDSYMLNTNIVANVTTHIHWAGMSAIGDSILTVEVYNGTTYVGGYGTHNGFLSRKMLFPNSTYGTFHDQALNCMFSPTTTGTYTFKLRGWLMGIQTANAGSPNNYYHLASILLLGAKR